MPAISYRRLPWRPLLGFALLTIIGSAAFRVYEWRQMQERALLEARLEQLDEEFRAQYSKFWEEGLNDEELETIDGEKQPEEQEEQPAKAQIPSTRCSTRQNTVLEENIFDIPVTIDIATFGFHQSVLCSKQFPEEVPSDNVKRVIFGDDEKGAGIGSRILRMTVALSEAFRLGPQSMLTQPTNAEWIYTDANTCPQRSHDCYFARTTSVPQISRQEAWAKRETAYLYYNRHELDVSKARQFNLEWFKQQSWASGRTGCWFAAQLVRFLLHPNAEVNDVVKKARDELFPDEKRCSVAMHVRHGDKGAFEAALKPFSEYLKVMRNRFRFQYAKPRVLLITEDQAVVNEAQNVTDFEFVYTNYPRLNSPIDEAIENSILSGKAEMMNALVNLYASMDCDNFIGTFSSTWGRMEVLLYMGKYGCFPPMFSLDPAGQPNEGLKWQPDWGFGTCTFKEFEEEVKKQRSPDSSCAKRWENAHITPS